MGFRWDQKHHICREIIQSEETVGFLYCILLIYMIWYINSKVKTLQPMSKRLVLIFQLRRGHRNLYPLQNPLDIIFKHSFFEISCSKTILSRKLWKSCLTWQSSLAFSVSQCQKMLQIQLLVSSCTKECTFGSAQHFQ